MSNEYKIMVNGLPGKMATIIAEQVCNRHIKGSIPKMALNETALTGPGMPGTVLINSGSLDVGNFKVVLCGLHETLDYPGPEPQMKIEKKLSGNKLIAIDFVKGEGQANRNAESYFKCGVPFVMGSTGADYEMIDKLARETKTPCLAFPNMDTRIVAWMYGISQMAEKCPGAFEGADFNLIETHQADKEDTSGTMKDMLKHLGRLSVKELTLADITKIRDPKIQTRLFGVPEKWVDWHAYHIVKVFDAEPFDDGYTRNREDLVFKRHGGESYARGTMKALDFLIKVIEEGREPRRYTMFDTFG